MNLTAESLHAIMREYFPLQNDDRESDYQEELGELKDFEIISEKALRELLDRRAYEVLEEDRDAFEMTDKEAKLLENFMTEDEIKNRIRNRFWYSYPALLRTALEIEFGESYRRYAAHRDGLDNETQNK